IGLRKAATRRSRQDRNEHFPSVRMLPAGPGTATARGDIGVPSETRPKAWVRDSGQITDDVRYGGRSRLGVCFLCTLCAGPAVRRRCTWLGNAEIVKKSWRCSDLTLRESTSGQKRSMLPCPWTATHSPSAGSQLSHKT